MNEGSGTTTADASGNGRTATLTGSPTWTSNGYSGYGLTFNGATNYLNAPLGTAFGTNQTLSATAWVYATSTTNGPIFGVTDTAPGGGWNMPFLSIAGATVYGHIWNVNSNTPLSSTVTLNAWHHLAITYDPSLGTNNEKFYVDGALVAQGTGAFSNSGSTSYLTTYIPGAKPSGVNSYLNGLIDELRGYSRTLSANEITIIYNSRRTCASSACSACGGGLSVCSGACTNTTIDPNNCGTCGNVCTPSAGQSCTSGACVCASGTACGTQCVDTATDSSHCGMCNNACTAVTCPSCSHGIVGYWPLSEGSGSTSADASTVPANGLNVTLTGSPTWTTGYSGNAVSFDGATQYLNAPLAAWLGNNNKLSVSAWVYATSTTNGPIFGVTNTAPGGGWNMPFLSINGATVYGWLWQVNGNTPLSATVTLNAWHHLAITYDPTLGSANEKFYVDGVLSSSGTGTYSPAGGNVYWTTYIPGAKPSGVNSYLNGKIDEVRAFKRVLTDGEVKLLYDTKRTCSGSACSGCPTGTTTCGTACTNTQYDPANCGACAGSGGSVCSGATPYCVNGACSATH
jgi:hypothetical protein